MSGIAELLVNLGYEVSGSDLRRSRAMDHLQRLGVRCFEGHAARQVGDADVVVVSSAVRPANPEVVEAQRCRIPVIPRAEMLAELMRLRYGIAVAGAHGKTTTTSMIAVVLEHADLDPTAVIGGRLSAFGSNARLGNGEYMVVEADESDRSFLKLTPWIAVLTNIDHEHLENYGSFEELQQAFLAFANRVPFHGAVVMCADDPLLGALQPRMTRRVITYGTDAAADISAEAIQLDAFRVRCRVRRRGTHETAHEVLGTLELSVPGRHNLQNALAAVAVGLELEIPFDRIATALGWFRGVERRFQLRGDVGGVLVVDDYGHHPTEITAVLAAARAGRPSRVLAVFQPHRYTRTSQLLAEFAVALAAADAVVLTDIYAAGEDPIPGVTVDAVAAAVRRSGSAPVHVARTLDEVGPLVAELACPGDLVLTLGAGSIGQVADRVVEELQRRLGSTAENHAT